MGTVFIPEVHGIIFLNWVVRYGMEKLADLPVYLMLNIRRRQLEMKKKKNIRCLCIVKLTNNILRTFLATINKQSARNVVRRAKYYAYFAYARYYAQVWDERYFFFL